METNKEAGRGLTDCDTDVLLEKKEAKNVEKLKDKKAAIVEHELPGPRKTTWFNSLSGVMTSMFMIHMLSNDVIRFLVNTDNSKPREWSRTFSYLFVQGGWLDFYCSQFILAFFIFGALYHLYGRFCTKRIPEKQTTIAEGTATTEKTIPKTVSEKSTDEENITTPEQKPTRWSMFRRRFGGPVYNILTAYLIFDRMSLIVTCVAYYYCYGIVYDDLPILARRNIPMLCCRNTTFLPANSLEFFTGKVAPQQF